MITLRPSRFTTMACLRMKMAEGSAAGRGEENARWWRECEAAPGTCSATSSAAAVRDHLK